MRQYNDLEEIGKVQTQLQEAEFVEEEVLSSDSDDSERYSHWVDANKASKAQLNDRPVIALCGKVWKPKHNPEDYPICPRCQELYEEIIRS
jgi:hypothetical protein